MGVYYLRDEALISGLKERDDSAFETLIDVYGDRILKVCYLILKDLPAAEDAVQEVFIRVYRSIGKFKENSSLYTWIYRIAVNKCRDLLRGKHEYSPFGHDMDVASDIDVEAKVVDNVTREKIRGVVFSMQPIYREVVTLFYFEDMSIKEICDVLDESEGTVKSKLHRARVILREVLSKEGMNYGER